MKIATRCVCCGSIRLDPSPSVLMPFIAHRIFGWVPIKITKEWGLRTIPEGTTYVPCNSLFCRDCGLSFLDMRFDDEEMQRLYSDYRGNEYLAMRLQYEPDYQDRNDRRVAGCEYMPVVEEFLRPHLRFPVSILDYGGDTGLNAPFINHRTTLHVYDIGNKPVLDGVAKDTSSLDARYDLIFCSNVLEHVSYPIKVLHDITTRMDVDTVLYIEVPAEEKKRFWHEHVNRFTEKSLNKLFEHCGMSGVRMRTVVVDQQEGAAHQIQAQVMLANKG